MSSIRMSFQSDRTNEPGKAVERYQAYLNNLRRELAGHLRSGVGVQAMVTPVSSGGAVLTLNFGQGVSNTDCVGDLANSVNQALERLASWNDNKLSIRTEGCRAPNNGYAISFEPKISGSETLAIEWQQFVKEAITARSPSTEMLLAPETVVLVKKGDDEELWSEQSSKSDADVILG